jgi:tRNA 5-methylaminomethyl-2-thiouridine biosynthesis bifunctional protein
MVEPRVPTLPNPGLDTSDAGFTPVIWGEDGVPRSGRFDDIYFSTADGLAESRAVFLQGCGLPEAWAGRDRFVVGELGFGSGLNILALLELWRRTREPGARLNVFSIEAFPIAVEDARRALAAWPELADLTEMLTARWPRPSAGFHRIDLPQVGAVIDVAVMDAGAALEAWTGAADAWFLDGFSPARNPGMWSERVLAGLARRSAPGARTATFTVAGAVRRGLAAQGFAVEKRPGFGRKSERLEARFPGQTPSSSAAARTVAIVGAGIAGAALMRAFRALGLSPVLFDPAGPAGGASGNPAALVMPRLDAGGGAVAALYAQAMARARDLYGAAPTALIARGALQLEAGPKDASRFDRIAASPLFAPGSVERLGSAAASARLGEAAAVGALALSEALVVDPRMIVGAWLEAADVRHAAVAALTPIDGGWALMDEQGRELARADIVCLAAGAAAASLAGGLPLLAVRGQVSMARSDSSPPAAIWGGYLIPTREGLLFGATHDRDEADVEVRTADHARNLTQLAEARPVLAAGLAQTVLTGRAGLRAVTPDFLPLAGAVEGAPQGLYVLSGLGSRGFCAAPLLAEHVAALATGAPSPLPADLAALVDPARFEMRRTRRLARSRVKSAT